MNTETYLQHREAFLQALPEERIYDALQHLSDANAAMLSKLSAVQLTTLTSDYQQLLRSLKQGYDDPTRFEQLRGLQARAYELGEQLHRHYRLKHTRTPQANVFRSLEGMHDVPSQREVLRGNASQRMLFEVIWTGEAWTMDLHAIALDYLALTRIPEGEKLMLVAAVMLSLLASFDPYRFEFLLDILQFGGENYEHFTRRLSDRAHVALVFVVVQQAQQLYYYPHLEARVRQLSLAPHLSLRWMQLQRLLLQCEHMPTLTQQLTEEILPQIEALSGGALMGDRFDFARIEQFEPQDKASLDLQGLRELFSTLHDLHRSGADITYPSFKALLPQLPFFKTAAHWFAHFTMRHPEVSRIHGGDPAEWKATLEAKQNDTDRFAYVKYFEAMTTSGRSTAVESADILMRMTRRRDAVEEYQPEEIDFTSDNDNYLRSFVQDCYRYFTLFAQGNTAENPFAHSLFLPDYNLFSAPFASEKVREAMFTYCQILEHDAYAEKLLATLPENFDRLVLRARLCQKLDRHEEAVRYLEKAQLIRDEEMLVHGLLFSYEALERHDEQLPLYVRLESLYPDNLEILLKLSYCLIHLKLPEEALERLHKADYLYPDQPMVLRQKAWVLFLLQRYEEAIATFDKLLQSKEPLFYDFYYAAYAHWLSGDLPAAVVLFTEGMRVHGVDHAPADFFSPHETLLQLHGLASQDLRMMIDLLNSDL